MASDFFFQDGTISYSNSSISIHGKTLPIAKYGLLARCRGNRDDIEPNADGWKRKFLMGWSHWDDVNANKQYLEQ